MLLADLDDQYLKLTGMMRGFKNMMSTLMTPYLVLGRSDDQNCIFPKKNIPRQLF